MDSLTVRGASPRQKQKPVAPAAGLFSHAILLASLTIPGAVPAHAQPLPDEVRCSPEYMMRSLRQYAMPDVVGCNADLVRNTLKPLEPLGQHGTSERPAGVVYKQTPDAGTSVRGVRPVLWVSQGPPAPVATEANVEVRALPNEPASITVGGNDRFRFVVRNIGPAAANPVRITGAWEGIAEVTISGACNELPCEIPRLPAGAELPIEFDGRVESRTYAARLVATAGQIDQDPANNGVRLTRKAEPLPPPSADLRIAQIELPGGTAEVGGSITYRIEMENLGPAAARNVTLSHTTTHLQLLHSSRPQSCIDLPCRFERVRRNEAIGWNVEFRITEPGLARSTVEVRAESDDPALANNSVALSTNVPRPPPPPRWFEKLVKALPPWWPWLLAALAAGGAASAVQLYRKHAWSQRIQVTPTLEPIDGISIGDVPFDAPPLSIGLTTEMGDAATIGSIPVLREESVT